MTDDENVKTASIITCTACGCLVSVSYWATHTGVCEPLKSQNKARDYSKQNHDMQMVANKLHEKQKPGYWR